LYLANPQRVVTLEEVLGPRFSRSANVQAYAVVGGLRYRQLSPVGCNLVIHHDEDPIREKVEGNENGRREDDEEERPARAVKNAAPCRRLGRVRCARLTVN
jgi:hypothetical protein